MSVISFQDSLSRAQADAMREDPSVFVFGLDVADHKRIFGSTNGIVEEFGSDRIFPTPLSEDAMTGIALGAAINGMKPIHVHIRTDFMLLGMNQIANMISCIRYLSGGQLKVPLVIRAAIGRGWGQGAQHSKTLHNFFAHLPGLKVMMPTTPQDAYSMLRGAIDDPNPVIFLEHRWLYFIEDKVDFSIKDSKPKAKILREGSDVSIIASSWMTVEAMKAAEILAKHNISAEVLDLRSIAPIDKESIVNTAKKTGRVIVADYDWVFCGLSSEVASIVMEGAFEELKKPVARVGFQHVPCPTTRVLEDEFYPNSKSIIRETEKILGIKELDLSDESFYSYENRFKGPF